jgi:hypothetical protein
MRASPSGFPAEPGRARDSTESMRVTIPASLEA